MCEINVITFLDKKNMITYKVQEVALIYANNSFFNNAYMPIIILLVQLIGSILWNFKLAGSIKFEKLLSVFWIEMNWDG